MPEFTDQDIQNLIMRDRMITFLTAAINWGTQTGMAPQTLEAGKAIYATLHSPRPQDTKEEEKKEEE